MKSESPVASAMRAVPDLSRFLNVGCGHQYHPGWTNVDLQPCAAGIQRLDVLAGRLPFRAGSFDVVYHAHLLEHLPRERALPFLRECHRVLSPGGILRVVVPDLEDAARRYLESLEKAVPGVEDPEHEWATLELLDQLTRERSGGEMLDFVRRQRGRARALALERLGVDGPRVAACSPLAPREEGASQENFDCLEDLPSFRGARGLLSPSSRHAPRAARRTLFNFSSWLVRGRRLWNWLFGSLRPRETSASDFRASGEIHRWMYDRHSLSLLLAQARFADVRCQDADRSLIPNWSTHRLDVLADGSLAKPGSLYVEGRKE